MAAMRSFHLYVLVLVQLFSFCTSDKQPDTLNVLSILLPYSTAGSANVNFTITASDGCYKWTSSRPEIAKVVPKSAQQDALCSQEGLVTSHSSSPEKQTAIIIAREKVTDHVLRCDVFVNRINQIDITTTTRELLLGQSPELLDVQAYDDTGNLFSSLDGLVFDWELVTVEGSIEASYILRIVPFAESINETSTAIYELEAKGLRGNSIIVEGLNTGTAIVRATLSHPNFKNVAPSNVKLLVTDNIMIVPSMDVYIMINTAVKYSVMRFRQNTLTDIEMPSSQFKFELSNTTVGVLDVPSSRVIGRVIGYTQVVLLDNNILDSQSSRQPVAGIHVIQPDHLGFTISPGEKWILETNYEYSITVDIYDKQNHKFYAAENVFIDTKFPNSHFNVLQSTKNGSYHIARTLKSGKTVLNAVLTSVKLITTGEVVHLNPPITGEQEVIIYDKILVTPAVIVFPWIPASGKHYRYQLKATGGSGTYSWSSDVETIATANGRGLLTTTADTGFTSVKAHDVKNAMHFGLTEVYVLPPDNLKFLPSKVEAEIGSQLQLPLSAAAYLSAESNELKFFDDCRKMNLTISLSDSSIFQVIAKSDEDDNIIPPSCTSVHIKALRQGYAIITARYKYKDVNLKASVTVAAYLPLKPLDPVEIAVVTLGSAKNLILQGGPQPWVHDRSTHYEKVHADQEDLISIRNDVIPQHPFVDKSSLHFYHVTCKSLGEQDLVVSIGNRPSETNLYPASSNATIRFACMLPAALTLEPDVKLPEIAERRLSLQDCQSPNKEFHVRSPQDLKLRIILRDEKNRLFDNFTSLHVSWASSNHEMASFDTIDTGVEMEYTEDAFKQHAMKSMSYQVCHLKHKEGSVTIKAAVTRYRQEILQRAEVKTKQSLKKPLTASLRLSLTSDIRVEPTEAAIFNHPSNKVNLKIFGGSGHFLVTGSDDDIANISSSKSLVRIVPKHTGVVTVTVYDWCLDSPNPATAHIRVSDIDSILVAVVDKVELGHLINCTVMVLDELDKPLLVSSLELLNLTPRFSRDLLSIKPSSKRGLDKVFYNLRGVAIGNTILTFTASPPQKPQIMSDPKHIQVFPPLRLDPRHIILMPGATFQLRATGGPYPQVTTLFSIINDTVASVDSVGLIEARVPGKSLVTGAVEATDPQSGHTIVFSKDHVIVEVLCLTGVKIFTPSTNLVTETEIGLRAVGLNDESPFTFANAVPGIEFHWTSSNIDVCKLKSVYDKSGITIDTEKAFRVVLCCNQPGEVVIKLQAVFIDTTHIQAVEHADLYDDVRIQVFEKLRLIYPSNGFLLLPHDVNVRIRTNRDGGKLSYSLMDVCPQSSPTDSRPLLTVDNRGHVQTGMISGTAGILVTSREDFGVNQTIVVHVEVKSVASISISPQTSVHTLSHKLHAFPVGMSAIFSVHLHDNVGRKFDSCNVPLKHRLNRPDSIHISQGPENGTYSIRAHNNGEAILNIWLVSSTHIADYVHLRATHAIVPFRPYYYLGDIICFKETVVGDEDNGVWWASKDNVLSVSPRSGWGIAISSGNSLVYYNSSNLLPTYIEVKVSPVNDVIIPDPRGLVVSNSPGPSVNGSYVINVRFGDARDSLPGCSVPVVQGSNSAEKLSFPFSCNLALQNSHVLDADELFDVRPGYEFGKSACFIFPKSMSLDDRKIMANLEGRMLLSVSLLDPSKGTEVTSHPTGVDYLPSFFVENTEVELDNRVKMVEVEVRGVPMQLNSLTAFSHSSSIAVTRRDDSDPTVVYFKISLVDDSLAAHEHVIIEIKSSLTTQVQTITVLLSSGVSSPEAQPPLGYTCPGPSCRSSQSDDLNFGYVLIIFFTIAIAILLVLLCRSTRQPRPLPRGAGLSPYRQQSPYPDGTRNPMDSFAGTPYPYNRSDVSSSRRRQSPTPLRRTPTGASPKLFSVTQ